MSAVRAIRGAITVEADQPTLVLTATEALLRAIVARNALEIEDVVSVLFTLTPDLCSEFPAVAARQMGWTNVALLDCVAIAVPHGLPKCIRVLLHVNTQRTAAQIVHVYLGGARVLRPDLAL